MKRFLTYLILISIFTGASWAGFSWFEERQHYESTDNAYLKTNSVLITPKVAGYITDLRIDDNQTVKKGEIIAVIDDRDYQAKLEFSQAQVIEAQAHIQRVRATKNTQHANIASADAAVSVVQAKRHHITQDLERLTALIERGSAPQQILDKMHAESKQATAELRGSQAAVSAQQKQLTSFDSEISEAEARVKQMQAQVSLAKIDLDNTKIRAPFDGVIGHRGVQIGAYVEAGTNLAYLLETQKIWAEANFKETQIENMKVGQPVKIHVDAYPNINFTGKVDSFAPASGSEFSILPAENATGNFTKIVRRVPVKIVFDANENTVLLKSGFSVNVKVQVKPL
ncbi:MAG: HlyD family secretion protein [Methylococcales bacterium]|nr:HlyD family secretion protein [Methylococcales bacterium]